jgi:transposase InsO family protein
MPSRRQKHRGRNRERALHSRAFADWPRISEPNHVWASDITYIPMALGFLYLVAIIYWASRAVLACRMSNTMDTGSCIAALDEALARHASTPIRARSSPAQPSPAGSS